MRRGDWANVGKGSVVRDRADKVHPALQSPDDLLVVAAGGPAGGFGAVIAAVDGQQDQGRDRGDRRLRRLRAAEALTALRMCRRKCKRDRCRS